MEILGLFFIIILWFARAAVYYFWPLLLVIFIVGIVIRHNTQARGFGKFLIVITVIIFVIGMFAMSTLNLPYR